jgi:hypothetical protein
MLFMRGCGKNVEPGSAQMTAWRVCTAGWVSKAIYTYSEHAIFIAFPLQQWLHERPSMLCYMFALFVFKM